MLSTVNMHPANRYLRQFLLVIHNLPKEKRERVFFVYKISFEPQLIEVKNLDKYIHIQIVHQSNKH